VTQTMTRQNESLRRRTAAWVVGICFFGLVFDGYDLVVYGAVVSTLLHDPAWALTPAQAGAIGSYALFGMMAGALAAGAVGDIIGRRRLMLVSIAWFSVGMGLTALAPGVTTFGLGRLFTGIGIGSLVAGAGAVVAEFAPPGKWNLYNAIVFAGYPVGGVVASIAALFMLEPLGFRALFWIGALPLITLLPLAIVKLPESPSWLLSRGRADEARAVSARTGVPLADGRGVPAPVAPRSRGGLLGLATRQYAIPTLLIGLMSAGGLMLTYALNTWLPELMGRAGFSTKGSLSFLLVLNGGAIIGSVFASRFADRFGPKIVVVSTFTLAAVSIALLTLVLPVSLLFLFVAVAGLGTIGTQVLIYGFVSNYYDTSVRAAGVAWAAGFGRLGGIAGPLVGGLLLATGMDIGWIFLTFALVALVGAVITALVPRSHHQPTPVVVVEPSVGAASTVEGAQRT